MITRDNNSKMFKYRLALLFILSPHQWLYIIPQSLEKVKKKNIMMLGDVDAKDSIRY